MLDPRYFDNAKTAGSQLRQLTTKPGRVLEVGPGLFDLGGALTEGGLNYKPAPGTVVVGRGPGVTILKNAATSSADGACFQLNHGVRFVNCTLAGPDVTEASGKTHAMTVGWGGFGPMESNQTAWLDNVQVVGGDFQIYAWGQGSGQVLVVSGGEVVGGRWLVTNGNSSGDNGCYIDLLGVRLVGDYRLGWAADPNYRRIHGITGRGGLTRMVGGSIRLFGSPEATDVRAAYTPAPTAPAGRPADYESGHPLARVELTGVSMYVEPRGAANAADVEANGGAILVDRDCRGSGPAGNVLYRGPGVKIAA